MALLIKKIECLDICFRHLIILFPNEQKPLSLNLSFMLRFTLSLTPKSNEHVLTHVFLGVGKTSLVAKYIANIYSKEIGPTIGASFFTCKINLNNTKVKMQLWDTA